MAFDYAERRLLVTGGAGLIGQHLVAALLARGARVLVLDNFTTGRREALTALAGERLQVLEGDVTEPFDAPVDGIFNLACPASPPFYQRDPVATWRASVLGVMHLAALAERRGIRLLQASTSEVYGDPLVHPQVETHWGNVNPIGPRACYDEGKRAAETLLTDLHRLGRVDGRIARIFNTYGPGMTPDDGRMVSNFIVQALAGEPLTLHGDGSQTRSLCYVSDTVEALLTLFAADVGAEPVNLGNPTEYSVRQVAEAVLRLTGSRSPLALVPRPVDDPAVRRPDIGRARERLGWAPVVALEEGLSRTIRWFSARLPSAG